MLFPQYLKFTENLNPQNRPHFPEWKLMQLFFDSIMKRN